MIEGRLDIDLYRNDSGVERAEIASSRPLQVSTLFENKTPSEVSETLPLLFSVCGTAQGCAAAAAMEQATGSPGCPVTQDARAALVLAETAREHLLRIALHWPRFLGGQASGRELKEISQLPARLQASLFADRPPFAIGARALPDLDVFKVAATALEALISKLVFGEPAEEFLARPGLRELEAWARGGGSIAARLVRKVMTNDWAMAGDAEPHFLPRLDDDMMLDRLFGDDADGFTAKPEWAGAARETTALTRRRAEPLIADVMAVCGTGLLTRIAARLVDVALIPQDIRACAAQFNDARPADAGEGPAKQSGSGLAQVEAARGRLVHGVRIERGRVARYRILAPTEWNFHPAGAAARGLGRLTAAGEADLTEQAGLLIEAIDPCVGYELRLH